MSGSSSFLDPWLTDIGALLGLAIGFLALFRLRPRKWIEKQNKFAVGPDLFFVIYNPSNAPIRITSALLFPGGAWGISASLSLDHTLHSVMHKVLDEEVRERINRVVQGKSKAELRILQKPEDDSETEASFLLAIIFWRRLSGIPWVRLPMIFYLSKSERAELMWAEERAEPERTDR